MQYNARKQQVTSEIYHRAFVATDLLENEGRGPSLRSIYCASGQDALIAIKEAVTARPNAQNRPIGAAGRRTVDTIAAPLVFVLHALIAGHDAE